MSEGTNIINIRWLSVPEPVLIIIIYTVSFIIQLPQTPTQKLCKSGGEVFQFSVYVSFFCLINCLVCLYILIV